MNREINIQLGVKKSSVGWTQTERNTAGNEMAGNGWTAEKTLCEGCTECSREKCEHCINRLRRCLDSFDEMIAIMIKERLNAKNATS